MCRLKTCGRFFQTVAIASQAGHKYLNRLWCVCVCVFFLNVLLTVHPGMTLGK